MDINNSGSAVNQGLIGMQRSQQEIVRSAEQITQVATQASSPPAEGGAAAQGSPTMNIVEALVNMKVQQQVFDSSAKVVSTANDMLGSLLDTKA